MCVCNMCALCCVQDGCVCVTCVHCLCVCVCVCVCVCNVCIVLCVCGMGVCVCVCVSSLFCVCRHRLLGQSARCDPQDGESVHPHTHHVTSRRRLTHTHQLLRTHTLIKHT